MTNTQLTCRALVGAAVLALSSASAAIPLADAPIFSSLNVPGNLALALSVEYPTAVSVANQGNFSINTTYYGYFDSAKCYRYVPNATNEALSYFEPTKWATGGNCTNEWSGNFLNWATMPTIDPFRWALTGGYRSVDTASETILQKSYTSNQGGTGLFPLRGTTDTRLTPFASFNSRVAGHGIRISFSRNTDTGYNSNAPSTSSAHYTDNNLNATTTTPRTCIRQGNRGQCAEWRDASTVPTNNIFHAYVRVKVCVSGLLESNCKQYGSNHKPEGLMQQYADKLRYSAFSFLYQSGQVNGQNSGPRQGGVMRSRMNYIGPSYPVALSSSASTNTFREWDANTGVQISDPDPSLDSDSSITRSGTINFLNEFGNTARSYMSNDAVSELYYAVLRYYQNLGNVHEWSNNLTASHKDGFPAPTTWDDPIIYACQKNFILGIGDSNTHFDTNVGGAVFGTGGVNAQSARPVPSAVLNDPINKANEWTRLVLEKEMKSNSQSLWGFRNGVHWKNSGSSYMAGLAYGNHVYDMRPGDAYNETGKQTVSTFWVDVMEGQFTQDQSPYWLAAKYGGFKIPTPFDEANPALDLEDWSNAGEAQIAMRNINANASTGSGDTNRNRPQNFFLAGNAGQMVSGLTQAFDNIAAAVNAYTTSVTPTSNIVSEEGTTSYSASYNSEHWSGTIKSTTLSFQNNVTNQRDLWNSESILEAQFDGSGWDSGRKIITYNPETNAGVPFRLASLASAQQAALDTSYVTTNDRADYLNYLRGDTSKQIGSASAGLYRERGGPLGDVVNSKLTLSAAPSRPYSEIRNPGYAAFKAAHAARRPLLLFGANDGMLHALDANASGTDAGKEVFAYIPSHLFYGPNGSTSTHANSDGLAALGSPNYSHRFYVDATPKVFDADFAKVNGASGSADWRTMVVGGLGKGGKGYYAIDITSPGSMSTEAAAAGKVLWEISNSTPGFERLGFTYGAPIMVKTGKYGWTLILSGGYNGPDNTGRLYLVNPKNGNLLETLSTGSDAPGMAHASAFVVDYTDGLADSVYAGDLNGKVWRFDLTTTSGSYPSPQVLFQARNSDGDAQPITVAPIPEIHPHTRDRMVLFGTGKLLDGADIEMDEMQSFYAISDGDNRRFATIGSALTRSDLTGISDLTSAGALATDSRGWYHDLGKESNPSGGETAWRVTLTAAAGDGVVLFTTSLTSGDACSPAGRGRAYAVDFSRGLSVLAENATGFADLASAPTDNVLFKIDGILRGLVGDMLGNTKLLQLTTVPTTGVRLINWREVNAVE